MRIYDISQEVFSCRVYDGDTAPESREVKRMSRGDGYNLTEFSMCAHNGTHLDAPFHFLENGRTVGQISLGSVVGACRVVSFNGRLTARDMKKILAEIGFADAARRILFKGETLVTAEAARVIAQSGVLLVGVEAQSVGDAASPAEVHKILLGKEVVLLEGIVLDEVEDGEYFLSAAPLNLGGADGAPCRAVLIK